MHIFQTSFTMAYRNIKMSRNKLNRQSPIGNLIESEYESNKDHLNCSNTQRDNVWSIIEPKIKMKWLLSCMYIYTPSSFSWFVWLTTKSTGCTEWCSTSEVATENHCIDTSWPTLLNQCHCRLLCFVGQAQTARSVPIYLKCSILISNASIPRTFPQKIHYGRGRPSVCCGVCCETKSDHSRCTLLV